MTAVWIVLGITSGICVLLALVYLLLLIRPGAAGTRAQGLLRDYAHRGLHGNGAPENSLAAFEKACRASVGIELDVQLSHDGEVMVFHDYTLARMTGNAQKLCDLDASVLQRISLAETEQTIPTLAQVLRLVDGRVPILVELKGENFDTSLCQKVAELLSAYSGAYCIESFNPLLVREIKKHLPNAFCGLLYTNVCRDKKKVSTLNVLLTCMAFNVLARPHFISYNKEDRSSLPVKLATRLYRAEKFVWTAVTDREVSVAHAWGESPIFEKVDPSCF